MGFSYDTRERAWARQDGLCAHCGKRLVKGHYRRGTWGAWHAHHRVPERMQGSSYLGNCVLLCVNPPENCHLHFGHRGNYSNRVVLHYDDLPYLRGDGGWYYIL